MLWLVWGSTISQMSACFTIIIVISFTDTSLRDGLFHEYKKHGKVTSVQVLGQGEERYSVVSFRK